MNLDFWLSSGNNHFWNPGQAKPATPWEARIDDLMRQQVQAQDPAERQRLFVEVQRVFGEHLPALYFVAPKVTIALSPRVLNPTPVPQIPQLLWSADTLAASGPRGSPVTPSRADAETTGRDAAPRLVHPAPRGVGRRPGAHRSVGGGAAGAAGPGDHLSEFELTPAQIAAERHRLGLDAPLHVQYFAWLRRFARFDLGESTRYPGRRVGDLIAERIGNTAILGGAALVLATALGIPLGVVSAGSRRDPLALATRGISIVLLALPPVVLSLGLLFLASRTGWFPVGGLPSGGGAGAMLHHLVLPVLALGLPVAATLERLQSRAMADALRHPSVQAARARGIPHTRLVW